MSKLSFMEQCAEKSKKEITKWLDDSHTREFQTKSKYIDMYNEKTELERILLQELFLEIFQTQSKLIFLIFVLVSLSILKI